jgi:hypothetical protein
MFEVKGNGNIVSKEINVSSFIRLHLGCKGLVELHQSNEEKVIVEADENLMDYFQVENAGRMLYISADGKFKKPVFTKCVTKVFFRQIDAIYIRNEGADVICPNEIVLSNPLEVIIQSEGNTSLNLNAPSIRLVNQSEGDVTVKGKCGSIKIRNQSEGNFNASELSADNLIIKNMAEGNIDLLANKEITIVHYGEGYIHYAGDAVLKDVKQYGEGLIKHV